MRLLLTRPQIDAEALREKLEALGHEVSIAPLIDIKDLQDIKLPHLDWQALFVTSGNGARALGKHPDAAKLRNLPVLAVGDQSAAHMREAGFSNVTSANGDVTTLAKLAHEQLNPPQGPVLHISGSVRAGDLKAMLGPDFDYHRIVLYEADAVSKLPASLIHRLEAATLDGILFYSPRTARVFKDLIEANAMTGRLSTVTAYCLSSAVARALPQSAFKTVKIASAPREDALLALLTAD